SAVGYLNPPTRHVALSGHLDPRSTERPRVAKSISVPQKAAQFRRNRAKSDDTGEARRHDHNASVLLARSRMERDTASAPSIGVGAWAKSMALTHRGARKIGWQQRSCSQDYS